MFILKGLAWGMPPPHHFMNLARSSRSHPLFHESPRSFVFGSLNWGEFNWKCIWVTLSTPS